MVRMTVGQTFAGTRFNHEVDGIWVPRQDFLGAIENMHDLTSEPTSKSPLV